MNDVPYYEKHNLLAGYDSKEALVKSYFDSYDLDTFEDYILRKKGRFQDSIEWCAKQNLPDTSNEYLIFKGETEGLLERRDPLEIVNIQREANGNTPFQNKEALEECCKPEKGKEYSSIRETERIYYEFYHEDENFRPELIKTPIDELKKMQF
jgi:hypothetical protein